LSREHPEPPANIGAYRTPELANMPRRGVIYALAPSHQNLTTIWAGTDDGLIQLTRDGGKTWKNVTPPELPAWAKVSQLDSSHFDDDTVYAAINTLRLDDLRPHVWRTHDGGGSWKEITAGLPDGATVDTVREDPVRKGLLYAGTERTVHVSFDDGEHWQPLRLNLPSTSIRDLVVHGDDLVAGTHGRSFWILDDVTPLRQITAEVAAAKAFLFQPQIAVRVRRSVNTDTPIPQEEPMGQNPPDGAILDYWLLADAKEVVLEIKDHNGKIVRRYASSDPPEPVDEDKQPYPSYWFRPARSLSAKAGMQRWVWDLHYPPPEGPRAYGMGAIYRDTPTSPDGPTALPGEYTAQLTVDGQPFTRLLAIRMDPRVVTPPEAIARQFEIALGSHERAAAARKAEAELKALRPRLEPLRAGATGKAAEALHAVDTKLAAIDEAQLAKVAATLTALMHTVEEADALPTEAAQKSWEETRKTCDELLGKWNEAKAKEVKALEQELGQQLVK
ncbi:MAG TPA: glycoside hydrolase, partial [Planctomycetota bacterium]|nr:glycoside hydrolase [Planctomycetota bacterium]